MIKLFHGSNVKVESPKIIISDRKLDFGLGFYLTSSEEQASSWAKTKATRLRNGSPYLNIYKFDDSQMSNLNTLIFPKADKKWLEFVVNNRKGHFERPLYDLICGPIANDSTINVINAYMTGEINEETAIILLLPQKLKDQYVFCSNKALEFLTFEEAKRL